MRGEIDGLRSPNSRVDHLAHNGCTILRDDIENLSLCNEPSCTQPFRVLSFEFTNEFILGELGRDRMEVWGFRIDRGRRSANTLTFRTGSVLAKNLREN